MADEKDTTVPSKPRLKKGEEISSPRFKAAMKAWHRAVALAEANQAKAEQDTRDRAKSAKRDVLKESESTAVDAVTEGVKDADTDAKVRVPNTSNPNTEKKKSDRVANSARDALEKRRKQIDDAVDGKKK